jgi:hypothetical protein
VEISREIDGKKYMWDGSEHAEAGEATRAAKTYQSTGFESQVVEEGGRFYVFTRKVVTEVKVEGVPPV